MVSLERRSAIVDLLSVLDLTLVSQGRTCAPTFIALDRLKGPHVEGTRWRPFFVPRLPFLSTLYLQTKSHP